ncbi:MAG: hypothetical protein WC919_03025 [Candidatus Paceibacterota bacterium]|jgi:hypothetical protein
MCEPKHSIIQYPDDDGDDQSSGTPTAVRISGWGEWLRKIGQWLHLSKMGKGHSEAIKTTSLEAELYLPSPTYYEVEWWRRRLLLDGPFRGTFKRTGHNALETYADQYGQERMAARQRAREQAMDAAQQYAQAVSIGNMTTFRRFLTTSLQKTDEPTKYVLHFELMLNRVGRDQLARRLKEFTMRCGRVSKTNVDRITKLLLGFTRKRELLIPEWADDKGLWVPPKPCWE